MRLRLPTATATATAGQPQGRVELAVTGICHASSLAYDRASARRGLGLENAWLDMGQGRAECAYGGSVYMLDMCLASCIYTCVI